ncbi:MAG: FtsX-like permease family protein [Byssovorax sp.]
MAGKRLTPRASLVVFLFSALVRLLGARNLRADRFGTLAAILGVAMGTATVSVVVVLDVNTVNAEAASWSSNPDAEKMPDTIMLRGARAGVTGAPVAAKSVKEETHEDYQVMRSAIRLGSLSAFLMGALIVFFTFGVIVDRRKREVALLRSLGALPQQVAAIFVREALLIGFVGAALGFVATIPMAWLAARAGITTTGRARILVARMVYPWAKMAVIALIGAFMALLGVLRPARDVLRLDVPQTLRPRFLEREGAKLLARRTRGIALIALPFTMLIYLLMRPFFRNALPSLTFFMIEAAFACLAFLATLMLVPDLVQRVGGMLVRLLPRGPAAERLLTQRRIELMGHELAWSVSGVMLVFSLLLALHISTHALKREVEIWADGAIGNDLFLTPMLAPRFPQARVDEALAQLPPGELVVHFSTRTPWPNAVHAVVSSELVALAKTRGRPELLAMAERLGPGKIILSKMMARRYRVQVGESIDLSGRGGSKRLEIVGVTDDIGYTPQVGPYRNSKTYGVLDAADEALIAPYVQPVGSVLVVAGAFRPAVAEWSARVMADRSLRRLSLTSGAAFKKSRVHETDRDFVIFDLILLLTSILAAVGIANQMVLSVHGRQREIALYRVLGMMPKQVRRLILLEGGFLGLLGGGLAALLGVPLGYASIGALRSVSAFEVAFELPVSYVIVTVIGSVVIAVAASIHPASKAARIDSAESVHYE